MKNLRIEITDKGTAMYIALDPDGVWARSSGAGELVTIDWDAQGRVIGIEAHDGAATAGIAGLASGLRDAGGPLSEVQAAVDALLGGRKQTSRKRRRRTREPA